MKYETARYSIRKVAQNGEFNDGIAYEIHLKNNWVFSDGDHIAYAESLEELRWLIKDIEHDIPAESRPSPRHLAKMLSLKPDQVKRIIK